MTQSLSRGARVRIRAFSILVSVVGVCLIAVIGFFAFRSGTGEGGPAIVTDDQYYDPWENPDPREAERDGDTWSGRGQAVIPLEGLTPGEPLLIEYDQDGPIRRVAVTGPDASVPAGNVSPPYFEVYDGPLYVIPSQPDIELWVSVRNTDAWSMRIEDADLEERSGTVSGIGPDAFLYTGTATAARVTTRSEYGVNIDIVTTHGVDYLFSSYETESGSVAWPDTTSAVFLVDASADDAAWSIQFFEALPSPGIPSPIETEAPDE